ncbi:sphere organelles protein-related [Euphorbia peplus]|nr:sphere organelles protein-related [Euphorbia peplus]
MESVRLRLSFDEILNKPLKNRRLDRCWVQLKPQHETISDLSSYILHAFNLHLDCPSGILLSMDDFALPPFESTSILKDNDIIRVEKVGGVSSDVFMIGNGGSSYLEAVDVRPVAPPMKLLANEEFEKESGGYRSEEEEDEDEDTNKQEDEDSKEEEEGALHIETTPEDKNVSRKRKASKETRSSKRKKSKSASSEACTGVVEDIANNANGEQNGSLRISKVKARRQKKSKFGSSEDCANVVEDIANNANGEQNGSLTTSKVKAKRSCEAEENGNGDVDASHSPTAKKLKYPSRSARRKKAIRKYVRQKEAAERKELRRKQLHEKTYQRSNEEDQPSNQMVCQESAEKDNEEVSEELPEKDTRELQEDLKLPDKNIHVEEGVVPKVIRPGHIRFVSLGEEDDEQSEIQNQIPLDNFQWSGTTSKKKGQKWGREKSTSNRRNNYNDATQKQPKVPKGVGLNLNFENLEFYTTLPKEGDVIAYRLIELSSSWTPELSSYRVGKISRYDMKSNRVRLLQVPGYPIFPEGIDNDASDFQPEASPYQSDGSLWTEFSSLIEVRLVKHGKPNSAKKSVAGGAQETESVNNGNETHASSQENGTTNPWEEISQALSLKKELLSQEDNWNKPESSRSWSYRALRGSAMGPTVAFLRAQNEI